MKKGFTLAELIGVIVVLALISLITIPAISKVLRQNKSSLCQTQMNNILEAARSYGADNVFSLPSENNGRKTITLGDLITGGYIEGNINGNVVTIREEGEVKGNIIAKTLNLKGKFDGKIKSERINIAATADIKGTLEYVSLCVEDGAKIEGDLKKITEGKFDILEKKTFQKAVKTRNLQKSFAQTKMMTTFAHQIRLEF